MPAADAQPTPSIPSPLLPATASSQRLALRVMWSPHTGELIDAVDPSTGRGVYGGLSIEQLRQEPGHSDAVVADLHAIRHQSAAKERARYAFAPRLIPSERYDRMLNILTPRNWIRDGRCATFQLRERVTDDLVHLFCKIGSQHFEMCDSPRLTHHEIVRACRRAPA